MSPDSQFVFQSTAISIPILIPNLIFVSLKNVDAVVSYKSPFVIKERKTQMVLHTYSVVDDTMALLFLSGLSMREVPSDRQDWQLLLLEFPMNSAYTLAL